MKPTSVLRSYTAGARCAALTGRAYIGLTTATVAVSCYYQRHRPITLSMFRLMLHTSLSEASLFAMQVSLCDLAHV